MVKKIKEKKGLFIVFVLTYLMLFLIVFTIGGLYKKNKITKDIFNEVSLVTKTRTEKINNYLNNLENKVQELSEIREVKSLLKNNTSEDRKKINESLNVLTRDYEDVHIISLKGVLVYTSDPNKEVGIDFEETINQNKDIFKNYKKTKESIKSSFYGPYLEYYNETQPKILVMRPVFEDNVLFGYIALVDNMDEVYDIFKEISTLRKTEESYLVNKDLLLISPFKSGKFDMFIQNIITENTKRCFSMMDSVEHLGHPPIDKLLNYKGDFVVGAHSVILGPEWCLLTEVNEEEIFNISSSEKYKIMAYFILITFVICGIIFLVFIIFKKYFLNIIKNFKSLKIKHIISVALVFSLIYFFFITSFFQGWENAAFYDEISDLLTIFVVIILLLYGFKLKNRKASNLIILGSILIIIDKLLQIILEEYIYAFGLISSWFWIPGAIIGFAGLLLVFYGFNKNI
ncbi:hypothetical protein KKH36_02835 [Patescibacteria group bacterium]|nr:hypothetical protein [Patescibacteria group bacterium]